MFRRHGVDVARATVARARQAPKTSSGKIARRRCREALEAGALDVVYATEKVAGAEKTCARGLSSAERKKLANALADASDADVLARCRRLVGAVLRVDDAAVDDDAPVNALGRGGRVSEVATMPPRRRRRRDAAAATPPPPRLGNGPRRRRLGSMEGLHLVAELERAFGVAVCAVSKRRDAFSLRAAWSGAAPEHLSDILANFESGLTSGLPRRSRSTPLSCTTTS